MTFFVIIALHSHSHADTVLFSPDMSEVYPKLIAEHAKPKKDEGLSSYNQTCSRCLVIIFLYIMSRVSLCAAHAVVNMVGIDL